MSEQSNPAPVLTRLGTVPVGRFMRSAWQRRPLVIRNALPGFVPPVDRARLAELARRDDIETRLVMRDGDRWSVRAGPFARLPSRQRHEWTLLAHGVDLADAAAHALLARFRFVPDARLDDLMVSYATDGGGVGPHVDSYDVFLLQAAGTRRWRVSRQRDLGVQPDQPLRVLAAFRPAREWTLGPGDLLYLPPGVAHEGTAVGESLTYSIGFRAPTYQELVEPWLADLADHTRIAGRYADAGLVPTAHPAQLPAAMARRVHERLARVRATSAATRRFLLCHLSEPKSHVVFERPPASDRRFEAQARVRGVMLDVRSKMLYSGSAVAINGELLHVPRAWKPLLASLADRRHLDPVAVRTLPAAGRRLLHDWYRAGWLHVAPSLRSR